MSQPVKKWTKRDLKSLTGAIDHWWTFNAMYLRDGVTKAHAFETMPAGERGRIVLSHLKGFASLLEDRIHGHTGYKATHEHYASKNGLPGWGDTTETVERFQRLERETQTDLEKVRAMIARVELEGLPPEVETYIPPDR